MIPFDHLAGGNLMLLPFIGLIINKDRVFPVSLPAKAIFAGCISNRIRLILLSTRIPHFEDPVFLIPNHMRTHYSNFFPGKVGRQYRIFTFSFPVPPIGACGIADPGMIIGLSGIPHMIDTVFHDYNRAIQIFLPFAGFIIF